MVKIKRKIFNIYAFPGVLRGHVWEIVDHHYYNGDSGLSFLIELPLGKVVESVNSMASICSAIAIHYENMFDEKIYFIPVDFVQGELID